MSEAGRFYWKFPEQGVRVQWRPRVSEFSILFDGDCLPDGTNRVQIVRVEDHDLADSLMASLRDGICPLGDTVSGWPVEVDPSNGIPADERWHRYGFVVMVVDADDPDSEPEVHYVMDPMDAELMAKGIWNDMPDELRGHRMVLACRIGPDFPITGDVDECIWVSDPDSAKEFVSWEGILPVATSGGSLILRITPACKRIRCQPGDMVKVTIRKI